MNKENPLFNENQIQYMTNSVYNSFWYLYI